MTRTELPTPPEVKDAYGIDLDQADLDLLEQVPAGDPYFRQRRHVLLYALQPIACPACLRPTCRRACAQVWEDNKATPDDAYACHRCGARLVYHMGLIAGQQWFTLQPGQTITAGEVPAGETPG